MEKINTVVVVYNTHSEAEEAIAAFNTSDFDMKKLSIVGKQYHSEEHMIGFYDVGERMKVLGQEGDILERVVGDVVRLRAISDPWRRAPHGSWPTGHLDRWRTKRSRRGWGSDGPWRPPLNRHSQGQDPQVIDPAARGLL